MSVIRYQSPTEFLSATEDFRSAEIVRTNLISGIANSVANGSRVYEAYYWWTIQQVIRFTKILDMNWLMKYAE